MASADIGEFGPTDGKAVVYRFSPPCHAEGLIPWLLVVLAFVGLRENRTAQAAWILAPVALLAMIYLTVMKILRPDSGGAVQLNAMFTAVVVGFSLIWLLAERIGNRNRLVTLLLATLIYLGFLGLNLRRAGLGKDVGDIAFFAAVSILPIVFAFLIGTLSSLRSFSKARFIACAGAALVAWVAIFGSTVTLVFDPSVNRSITSRMIIEVLGAFLLLSLVYFVALLPFLVLLFTNRFWRRRFECVTGLRTTVQ